MAAVPHEVVERLRPWPRPGDSNKRQDGDPRLTSIGAQVAVLTVMYRYYDRKTGTTFVSEDRIAREVGRSPRDVRRTRAALRAQEVIRALAYATGGRHRTTVYWLPPPPMRRRLPEPRPAPPYESDLDAGPPPDVDWAALADSV